MEYLKLNRSSNKMFLTRGLTIALVICMFVTYSHQQLNDPEFMKAYRTNRAQCVKEIGVTDEDVQKAWDAEKFPDDAKINCYFKCILTKFGVLDATGDVVDEPLKKFTEQLFSADLSKEIDVECNKINGAGGDLCKTAFQLMTCIAAAKKD